MSICSVSIYNNSTMEFTQLLYLHVFYVAELCIGMHCLTPVFAGVGCWLLCCFIEEAQSFFSWTCRGSQAWWEKQSIECTRHNTSIDWNDLLESFRSTLLLGSYASICNTVSHYTLLYLTQEQSSLSEIHLRKNFVSFQCTIWLCWWFCLDGCLYASEESTATFSAIIVNVLVLFNRRLNSIISTLKDQPPCPQLYLYSSGDKVIPASVVERFIQEQKALGRSVRAHDFGSSPHVDHYRNFPQIYSAIVNEFLKHCCSTVVSKA